MKLYKIGLVSVIAVMLGFSQLCFAAEEYKTANAFVRITTNMLGYNFIAKKVAQSAMKKSLKKCVAGDYKIKFDSFSGVDLKKGIFRGLDIDGKNLSVENELYISQLHMATTSDFNYVDYRSEPMVFKTDVPLAYEVEMTESDLDKTLFSEEAFDTISRFIPLVTIEKPSVKIVNDKIRINSSLKFPFAKAIKFSMSSGLKVENGKIVMTDVESSGSSRDFAGKLVNLINKQNMLDNINLNIFENTDTVVQVQNVNLKDKKLYITGQFLIKKSN